MEFVLSHKTSSFSLFLAIEWSNAYSLRSIIIKLTSVCVSYAPDTAAKNLNTPSHFMLWAVLGGSIINPNLKI